MSYNFVRMKEWRSCAAKEARMHKLAPKSWVLEDLVF